MLATVLTKRQDQTDWVSEGCGSTQVFLDMPEAKSMVMQVHDSAGILLLDELLVSPLDHLLQRGMFIGVSV